MTDRLTVALWATNLAAPLASLEAWTAGIEAQMLAAKAEGADLLVMPEYAAEQWLSFAPRAIAPGEEIPWMAEQAPAAVEAAAPLAAKHGIALLAGSMPVVAPDVPTGAPPYRNRAYLFLPDGQRIAQDKLSLTPAERDSEAWNLSPGNRLEIVTWRGLRLAILICLDVEMPALSSLLAPHDIDLLLVPSMTAKLAGYARVFGCAKARAVELQAAVCAVGCIGTAATGKPRDGNVSGAAVYVPCEEVLGHTGLFADLAPQESVDGLGPMLIARDLPFDVIRELRAGEAEVWPGAWRADHVAIVDPARAGLAAAQ